MSEVTAVPIRPLARGAMLKLWLALAVLIAAAVGIAWLGTRAMQVTITKSGLRYQVISEGTGPNIQRADMVRVHYVGRANGNYKCDTTGPYYSYDQTVPYREASTYRGRNSGRYNYSYYERQGCRLAPAPVAEEEYRYVRVCPDANGAYRITG